MKEGNKEGGFILTKEHDDIITLPLGYRSKNQETQGSRWLGYGLGYQETKDLLIQVVTISIF